MNETVIAGTYVFFSFKDIILLDAMFMSKQQSLRYNIDLISMLNFETQEFINTV